MEEEKLQGIILKSIPYQDHHHIVSAFTGERGMVRLFVRGTHRARRSSHAICTPLVLAELLFRTKSSGLYTLRDGHVIDPLLGLRSDYPKLEAAGQMVQSLLTTLWPGKPAPKLFVLFIRYLKALEKGLPPKGLVASFLCKLLKHEGQWVAPLLCATCKEPLQDAVVVGGEAYCPKCCPDGEIALSGEERERLANLTDSRKLDEIGEEIPSELGEKVAMIFNAAT